MSLGGHEDFFLPYTSDGRHLATARRDYPGMWKQSGASIDEFVEMRVRRAKAGLKDDPGGLYVVQSGSRTWTMPNLHARLLRGRYRTLLDISNRLELDESTRMLLSATRLAAHVRHRKLVLPGKPRYNQDEVVAALGYEPFLFRKQRQLMVADVLHWVDLAFDQLAAHKEQQGNPVLGDLTFRSASRDAQPLLGMQTLGKYDELRRDDVIQFLRGMVLLPYANDFETRMDAARAFDVCLDKSSMFLIGGGEHLPFDMDRTTALYGDVHPRNLPIHGVEGRERLRAQGVVVFDPREATVPAVQNHYNRFLLPGVGFSDDAGLVALNEFYGNFAMLGGIVSDGLDAHQYQIYEPFYGSLEFYAARYIEERYKVLFGEDLVSHDEKVTLVYLGAEQNTESITRSSSHKDIHFQWGDDPRKPREERQRISILGQLLARTYRNTALRRAHERVEVYRDRAA